MSAGRRSLSVRKVIHRTKLNLEDRSCLAEARRLIPTSRSGKPHISNKVTRNAASVRRRRKRAPGPPSISRPAVARRSNLLPVAPAVPNQEKASARELTICGPTSLSGEIVRREISMTTNTKCGCPVGKERSSFQLGNRFFMSCYIHILHIQRVGVDKYGSPVIDISSGFELISVCAKAADDPACQFNVNGDSGIKRPEAAYVRRGL